MSRYIKDTDVYKLVEPNGIARVHCSQIDELPRADVVEVKHGEPTDFCLEENCLVITICKDDE